MAAVAGGSHASSSSFGSGGMGSDNAAFAFGPDSAADIDRLFREVQASCRQHDRDRSNQGISKAMLEFQAATAEEQLQAARLQNTELARRAWLLDHALQSKRSEYAARLRPGLCRTADAALSSARDEYSGGDAVAEDAPDGGKPLSTASLGGCLSSEPRTTSQHYEENLPRTRNRSQRGEQGQALNSWQYFEEHLPRTRKRFLRAELCQALHSIGVEHAESLFEEPVVAPVVEKDTDVTGGGGSASSTSANTFAPPSRQHEGSGSVTASGGLPWGWRATLRSHLDAVRCVALCSGDALLSCGEDAVIKAWSLTPICGPEDIVEPYATFRGHHSAVLSLAHVPGEGHFFSGGMDGEIRAWRLPLPGEHEPYGASPSDRRTAVACRQCVSAHRDAVWSLCLSPELGLLASTGADRSIRLWRPYSDDDAMLGYVEEFLTTPRFLGMRVDSPTSLAWAPHPGGLLAGFSSGACAIFDAEAGALIRSFKLPPDEAEADAVGESASGVLSVACHPSLDLAAAAHADRCVRLFSLSAGCMVQLLSGHLDAVTSVAFNPYSQFEIATGSHDGMLRLFDIRTGHCLRQVTLHDRKFGEAMHSICHAGDRVVTAGADANVVVLGLAE